MSNKTDGLILDLVSRFSVDKIIKFSFYAISCWIIMPIIIMVLNFCGVNGIDVYLIWVYSLYFIGAFGLIACLCYCTNELNLSNVLSKRFVKEKLPLIFLILFLLWSLFSCALSENRKMAFFGEYPYINSWFTFFLYGGIIFEGVMLAKDKKLVKLVTKIYIFISSLLAILSLINNSLTLKLFTSNSYFSFCEYQAVFYNTNHYAYYLLISVVIVSFYIVYSETVKIKVFGSITLMLYLMTLILNNTFGAYLSFFLTIVFMLIWWHVNKKSGFKSVLLILAIFIFVSAFSTLFTDNIKTNVISLFDDVDAIVEDEDTSGIGSNRGELWANALVCIKNEPIFGCGLENIGSVSNYDDEVTAPSNPHNFILFFAKHTGIPGAMLYLTSLFICLFRAIKQRKTMSNQMETSVFVVLAYLMSAFFGVAKFYTSPYFLIVLAIGMHECMLIDE